MAAGPRDTPHGRETAADPDTAHGPRENRTFPESRRPFEPLEPLHRLGALHSLDAPEPGERLDPVEPLDEPDEPLQSLESLDPLGSREHTGDGSGGHLPPMEDGQSFRALRPQRRLHAWQLVPIIALAVGGSLMFSFPLAFESGDAGPVVAMLGLLLCCCAAGWGLMAARRIGHTWPGLPPRGSGARTDWRFVTGYAVLIALLAVLAVWRVARLR